MAAALVSALDTYYRYVEQQIAVLNPSRKMYGIANARGWPLSSPVSGALYLLLLRNVEVPGTPLLAQGMPSSKHDRLYEYFCQWVWVLMGTDLTPSQMGQNRGDVYRTDMQIREELRQANYPGYAQKLAYTSDAFGNVTATPVTGEMIWWSGLQGAPKLDNTPGLVFGTVAVSVYAYSSVSALVA